MIVSHLSVTVIHHHSVLMQDIFIQLCCFLLSKFICQMGTLIELWISMKMLEEVLRVQPADGEFIWYYSGMSCMKCWQFIKHHCFELSHSVMVKKDSDLTCSLLQTGSVLMKGIHWLSLKWLKQPDFPGSVWLDLCVCAPRLDLSNVQDVI